jgi:hypothetical protein
MTNFKNPHKVDSDHYYEGITGDRLEGKSAFN